MSGEDATLTEVEAALGRASEILAGLWGRLPGDTPPNAAFRIGSAHGNLVGALDEIRGKLAAAVAPTD